MRFSLLLPCALALGACFPIRERWRPAFAGQVIDDSGAAVAGAQVVACTASHWTGMHGGCPRRAEMRTDAGGRFAFAERKEWDWVFPAEEAPLPFTLVVACDHGRIATSGVGQEPLLLVLSGAPTEDWARQVCR
jgi:hypothetical protein